MTIARTLTAMSLLLVASHASRAWAMDGGACGACNAPEPSCAQPTTNGTNECGLPCIKSFSNNKCDAPAPACGQTTYGQYTCGGQCSWKGPDCGWVPYGYVMPGDPTYGFPNVKNASGTPVYPEPSTTDFLGLAARGNIVIGDYTDRKNADGTDNPSDFPSLTVPRLRPQPGSPVQPYAIDPADEDLGYHDAGFDAKNRPLFSGDYTQVDELGNGRKLDGTPRRFYESTLADADFVKLVDPGLYYRNNPTQMYIDAVLFTNHTITGFFNTRVLHVNGAFIARDDTLTFLETIFKINHDVRLFDDSARTLELPFSLESPQLVQWEECPPAACPL